MSLLDEAMEKCTMIDKVTVPDGYGGFDVVWQDGAEFSAALALDISTQARIAQAQGVKNLYTVTTQKNVSLKFHDVFRRDRDLKTFRVTSDGADKHTPASATLNMRQVSAEEWGLTDEQRTGDN